MTRSHDPRARARTGPGALPLAVLLLLLALGACRLPSMRAGSEVVSLPRASLDDVTNELDDRATREAASNENSRAFGLTGAGTFADTDGDGLPDTRLAGRDRDGDVRGRTENHFAGEASPSAPQSPIAPTAGRRLMVYTAGMSLEVARVEDAIAAATAAATARGGYLAQRQGAALSLRVPVAAFEELLAALRALGRVLDESMQADEVTKQHRDLTIRLENARKARERLLALLDKATEVEDILKIETEITRLTERIEILEGELRYLDDRIAMATVNVRFGAARAADASGPPVRKASRFWWINRVGAERVVAEF